MAKIFLDLGTHYGEGLSELNTKLNLTEEWQVYSFEANPYTYKRFIEEHSFNFGYAKFYNKAASTYDGIITLNVETVAGTDEGMGSSLINLDNWDPWSSHNEAGFFTSNYFKKTVDVKCFSLSNYILNNFIREDFIVIKVDIEGAEYDLLEDLIETGAINFVNEIYIEWHSQYFTNSEDIIARQIEIENTLKGKVVVHEWK
jgi:FkbM family methyltransferase